MLNSFENGGEVFLYLQPPSQIHPQPVSSSDHADADSCTVASSSSHHHWRKPFHSMHRGIRLAQKVKVVIPTFNLFLHTRVGFRTVTVPNLCVLFPLTCLWLRYSVVTACLSSMLRL